MCDITTYSTWLHKLVKHWKDLKIQVRWNVLFPQEDTLKQIKNIYKDIQKMFERLLKRPEIAGNLPKNTRTTKFLETMGLVLSNVVGRIPAHN